MFGSNCAHHDFAVKLFRRTIKKNPAIFRNVTPETQTEEKITPVFAHPTLPSFRGACHSASKTRVNALMAREPGIQSETLCLHLDSGSGAHMRAVPE